MGQVLEAQTRLIEKGKPMTIAQMCVKKGWLTRSEARLLLRDDAPPSDLVAGYEVGELLGAGGMSWVYRARRSSDGRELALKVLKPNLARNERARARFEREGHLLTRFEHENIVKGYDVVEHDGLVALAMELVPGREVLELLDESGAFREDAALYVILQTARALTHMYEHGVVHRDIKPGNILITRDNTVKLCDLGLASDGDEGAVDDGTTVGTVEYISPEQALGGDGVDVRSDIYALGVTLYHLVVGEIPFQGSDDVDTMRKRFVESLSSPKLSRLSPHVAYFIQKMMATDREIRYQSPEELIADFEESIQGNKSLTSDPTRDGSGSELELERPFGEKEKGGGRPAPSLKSSRRPGRPPTSRRRRR